MMVQANLLVYRGFAGLLILLLLAAGWSSAQAFASSSSSSIATGGGPHAVTVNPVTNRIYIINAVSDSVTVLENTLSSGIVTVANVAVGTTPYAAAVNPLTDQIYVANADSDSVTVIDGATNSTAEVETGKLPVAIAVNTTTNKIYVANLGSDTVSIIDGAAPGTNTITVQAGESPFALAIDEAANKIYVANVDDDTLTVIDGASNNVSSIPTGAGPNSVAVNPLTGKVYVADFYSNTVTVLDGTTISTLDVGITPSAVEVNPSTGLIYVVNTSSNSVTVIDGATHQLATVAVGSGPGALAVNAGTNQIYTANYDSNDVTIIDGASLTTSTIAAGRSPIAVAADAGRNSVYVANFNSDELTVITEERVTAAELSALSVSAGNLSPTFDPAIHSYTVHVGYEIELITITAETYDAAASLSVSEQVYENRAEFPFRLQTGINVLTIVVQAADGITSKTYTLNVNRSAAPSGEGASSPPIIVQPEAEDVIETDGGARLTNHAATLSVRKAEETGVQGEATAVLHADSLTKALDMLKGKAKEAKVIRFELPGAEAIRNVVIPAAWFVAAAAAENRDAVVEIATGNGSYTLPLDFPTLTTHLKQLGGKLKDATVTLTMETIIGAARERVAEQAASSGIMLIGDIMDFTLRIEVGGDSRTFTEFGQTYVSRSIITAGSAISAEQVTAVRFDPQIGEFAFVPSTFTIGGSEIRILHPGNGLYAAVQSKRSFADMPGHWARAEVELLASKQIINGRTPTGFVPEGKVTRAEFASLIVRALGLKADLEAVGSDFADVAEGDWFAGAVGAAVKAQIVSGFGDGTFRPNDTITREQMSVMLAKALAFADKSIAVTGKLLPLLAAYQDKAAISSWAQVAVAQMTESGIMTGTTKQQFSPQDLATRAQAAVVIKRMLQTAGFIN